MLLGGCTGPAGIERMDANSRAAHTQLLKKAHTGRIDLYFLGDSITRRWGTADPQYAAFYANWVENFRGWNAADFGWGGDTTANILWRIRHGELAGVNPKVIVLMAGTNDLAAGLQRHTDPGRTVDAVVANIRALLAECRRQAPGATVILTSITPRADHRELQPLIVRINARLAQLAGQHVRYLDIYSRMSTTDGDPLPGMVGPDRLHLALGGYRVWARSLAPLLENLLGPRAATDTAPPPSRNPGLPG